MLVGTKPIGRRFEFVLGANILMRLRVLAAAVFAFSTTSPRAEASSSTGSAVVTRPTLFKDLPESMEQLIDAGYQVVNIGIGLTGFAYLLKLNNKYVTCAVQPDRSGANPFLSECRAMN